MKKYLLVYTLIILLSLAFLYLVFQIEYASQKEFFIKKSEILLKEESMKISENLNHIASDVLYLSHNHSLRKSFSKFLSSTESAELLDFLEHESKYDQLRTIDLRGKEVFRINRINGTLKTVQAKDLQQKQQRYYVQEAMQLHKNEFYISPLDLNVENKKVELPYKPTIRIATPVFDNKGQKQGIVLINVLYELFLQSLQKSLQKDKAELFIANSDGNWLVAPKGEKAWTFMFGKSENQVKSFSTSLWNHLNHDALGTFSSSKYLYNYQTINPLEIIHSSFDIHQNLSKALTKGIADKRLHWYFIIAIPHEVVLANTFVNVNKGLPYFIFGLIILLILATFILKQVEKILRQSEELKLTANCFLYSEDGMVITDESTKILQVNPRYQAITGYDENELVGRKTKKLSSGVTSDATYKEMWKALNSSGKWSGELKDRKKDGSMYVQLLRIIAIKNNKGEVKNYLGVTTDVTEKKNYDVKIRKLVFEDTLTGLPNRKLFQESLEHIILSATRYERCVAVLYIDLDNFKLINDTAGHVVGDKFLTKVSKRFESCVGKDNIIARFGGDEFFILMDFTDQHAASMMAENLLQSLKTPIGVNGEYYYVAASIGIALYPDDASTPEELIQHADTAMYKAKEDGKNRYRFFASELNTKARRQLSIEKNLNTAIQNNEFELFYQPQIELKTKSISGAEALLRWKNEELGNVSPAEFISLAELSEQIIPITMWVIEQSCLMAKTLKEMGKELSIAVNISSVHIKRENFDSEIYEFITAQGISPEQIVLEITEGSLIENIDETIQKLDNLKSYGFRIAIDDFGTGYSSLSYLKKFGFHKLKIDQAFIRALPDDEEDAGIARLIIAMSKVLNMKVVAEGAETQESVAFLDENNCDIIQGYYFSKPLPARDFLAFCENFEVTF